MTVFAIKAKKKAQTHDMSELELLKQEIIRLKEDLLKQKQQLEEENELLKKQLETKNNKVEIVDLEKALLALQRNFSAQWDLITNDLKLIYLNESGDAFKRRSFQLSQLWKTEEKKNSRFYFRDLTLLWIALTIGPEFKPHQKLRYWNGWKIFVEAFL